MEIMIRVFNDMTLEIIEKVFDNEDEADLFEIPLSFLNAHYEVYYNGERAY